MPSFSDQSIGFFLSLDTTAWTKSQKTVEKDFKSFMKVLDDFATKTSKDTQGKIDSLAASMTHFAAAAKAASAAMSGPSGTASSAKSFAKALERALNGMVIRGAIGQGRMPTRMPSFSGSFAGPVAGGPTNRDPATGRFAKIGAGQPSQWFIGKVGPGAPQRRAFGTPWFRALTSGIAARAKMPRSSVRADTDLTRLSRDEFVATPADISDLATAIQASLEGSGHLQSGSNAAAGLLRGRGGPGYGGAVGVLLSAQHALSRQHLMHGAGIQMDEAQLRKHETLLKKTQLSLEKQLTGTTEIEQQKILIATLQKTNEALAGTKQTISTLNTEKLGKLGAFLQGLGPPGRATANMLAAGRGSVVGKIVSGGAMVGAGVYGVMRATGAFEQAQMMSDAAEELARSSGMTYDVAVKKIGAIAESKGVAPQDIASALLAYRGAGGAVDTEAATAVAQFAKATGTGAEGAAGLAVLGGTKSLAGIAGALRAASGKAGAPTAAQTASLIGGLRGALTSEGAANYETFARETAALTSGLAVAIGATPDIALGLVQTMADNPSVAAQFGVTQDVLNAWRSGRAGSAAAILDKFDPGKFAKLDAPAKDFLAQRGLPDLGIVARADMAKGRAAAADVAGQAAIDIGQAAKDVASKGTAYDQLKSDIGKAIADVFGIENVQFVGKLLSDIGPVLGAVAGLASIIGGTLQFMGGILSAIGAAAGVSSLAALVGLVLPLALTAGSVAFIVKAVNAAEGADAVRAASAEQLAVTQAAYDRMTVPQLAQLFDTRYAQALPDGITEAERQSLLGTGDIVREQLGTRTSAGSTPGERADAYNARVKLDGILRELRKQTAALQGQ